MTTTNTIKIAATDLVIGNNNIGALIQEIGTAGKALDKMIQVGLCSVIAHTHLHGDHSQANSIIDNLPRGSRTNAARDFMAKFAPVRWNAKTSKFVSEKARRDTNFANSELFAEMLKTDWLSFRPESVKEFKPLDVTDTLEKMFKRVSTAAYDERNGISESEVKILKDALAAIKAARKEALEMAALDTATTPNA